MVKRISARDSSKGHEGTSVGHLSVQKIRTFFARTALQVVPFIPLPREWFRKVFVRDSEKRYASRGWDYLTSAAESHRYSIIVGCCEYFTVDSRNVIDIGCGDGLLQKKMKYSKYVGIDMNAEAIRAAKSREDVNTEFVLLPVEEYQPSDCYDVVIFNESLYYLKEPVTLLNNYLSLLADNGILIVSMFHTNLARKIWKDLRQVNMTEVSEIKISNEQGHAWEIKVYANSLLSPRSE